MLIIGCPFGNYLEYPGAVSTIGTFTLHRRPGRIRQVLRTVRYYRGLKSWVNRIGLRNPGIDYLLCRPYLAGGRIVSLHGFNYDEWAQLLGMCCELDRLSGRLTPLAYELNLSCPNVLDEASQNWQICTLALAAVGGRKASRVIVKLGPIGYLREAEMAYRHGIRWFHLCNTLPTPKGGMSGKVLQPLALEAVATVRNRFPDCVITGGGGITSTADIDRFLSAGADHVSVASMLLAPWNLWKPNKFVQHLGDKNGSTGDSSSLRHALAPA